MTNNESPQDEIAEQRRCPVVIRDMCLHYQNSKATCSACKDICPTDALLSTPEAFDETSGDETHPSNIDKTSLDVPFINKRLCLACNLCAGVCPTAAISYSEESLADLRQRIDRTAEHYDTVYLTCREAKATRFSGAMVEVPCLGELPAEFWFSCLAEYEGIAVYLPLNLCENCSCAPGETNMMEAITKAEQWAQTTLDLVTEKEDLDFYVLTSPHEQVDRRAFFGSITNRVADTTRKIHVEEFETILTNRGEYAKQVIDASRAAKKERDERFADAHETGVLLRKPKTMTASRKLLVETISLHPELAKSARISVSCTDKETCTLCKKCIDCCPVSARKIKSLRLYTDKTYCIGCGKCADVCPEHAIEIIETSAEALVSES